MKDPGEIARRWEAAIEDAPRNWHDIFAVAISLSSTEWRQVRAEMTNQKLIRAIESARA